MCVPNIYTHIFCPAYAYFYTYVSNIYIHIHVATTVILVNTSNFLLNRH